jgi:poly-gamma-glutamate capsule biosynthesis protein CapA/YwtB (metallophosphatase superfamily)
MLDISMDVFGRPDLGYDNDSDDDLGLSGAGLKIPGSGFGKGTRKKVLKGAKKAGGIAVGLVNAFGNTNQKAIINRTANDVKTVNAILKGSGCAAPVPGAKLRAAMAKHDGR